MWRNLCFLDPSLTTFLSCQSLLSECVGGVLFRFGLVWFEKRANLFPIWKEKTRIAFRDGTLVGQKLKHSFVSNLWSWNNLYIGEESSSLTGFLVWVALN